jgi:hypothetical protein
MPAEIKAAPASEKKGGVISLPPHLLAHLQETDQQVRERYGLSPGVELLAHLCIAVMTPGTLLLEFEETVLDIHRGSLRPNEKGVVDENSL